MSESPKSPRERVRSRIRNGKKIVVVDLFCGAGGMSAGLAEALEEIAADFDRPVEEVAELHAVNHDSDAIASHSLNHPWANHYNTGIETLDPANVVDPDKEVDLLIAAPDCTQFSAAKGGGRKDRDKRALPREVTLWTGQLAQLGGIRNVLVENVPAFKRWGPLDSEGKPIEEKKGELFENWLNDLTIQGFSVEHRVLNAADYGDATSRERLFIAGRKNSGVEWPEPTHSEDGHGDTKEWRSAAEIIDWSDPGDSLWIRDLLDGRRKPLVNNTMSRIAEGLRRHCSPMLDPFADILEQMGREDEDVDYPLPTLRDRIVPAEHAATVARIQSEPFLVRSSGGVTGTAADQLQVLGQHGGAKALDATEEPLPTVAKAGAISQFRPKPMVLPKNGLCRGLHSNPAYEADTQPLHTVISSDTRQGYILEPLLMQYSHGGSLKSVDEPLPTITTAKGGVFSLATPSLIPFYSERSAQRPRTHSIDEPMPTAVKSKVWGGLSSPYLVEYYGNGKSRPVTEPLPTVTSKDTFALVIPHLYPLGLSLSFRMLKPKELASAQGFDNSYEFVGSKTDRVAQIGNAVPVNLAKSLCRQMLVGSQPTLDSFVDGTSKKPATADD